MRKSWRIFFGMALAVILPFCVKVSADDSPGDSGNVKYGEFVDIDNEESGITSLETCIFEYMVTFPKETAMVPYMTKFQRIGSVTVEGKAFIKPYKVALEISKKDFKLVSKKREKNKSNKIEFDVTSAVKDENGKWVSGESLLGKTIYCYRNDLAETEEEREAYERGEVADINESIEVGITVADSQWKKASAGKYKGKITFTAKIDDTDIF